MNAMAHWRYDFECRLCEQRQYVKDEIRNGLYCLPIMNGEWCIHADDDRVVRCDKYSPKMDQMSLFERG